MSRTCKPEANARLYAKRKSHGLCIACGGTKEPERQKVVRCKKCAAKLAAYLAKRAGFKRSRPKYPNLKEQIIGLLAGKKMTQNAIAQNLGVSRGAVRNHLRKLPHA